MAAPRIGRNVISRKMSIWVGHYEPLELFCLWTKVHQFSFAGPNVEGVVVDEVFSDVRYVDQFRRYSRSKSKVVRNRAEIWTYLALPNYLASSHLEKFREDTSTSPEVIEAHTLNFKPNFKFSRLKFGGTPVPAWVCAR